MKHKNTLVRIILLMTLLLTGLTVATVPGAALTGFPADSTIVSATLGVFQAGNSTGTVYVHPVTEAWGEMSVTWSNAPAFGPSVGSFALGGSGSFRTVDVTGLVQGWLADPGSNFGVLLEQAENVLTPYYSREFSDAALRPFLSITYESPSSFVGQMTVSLAPDADAWIYQLSPNANFGADMALYTGMLGGNEKQSLIQFDLVVIPGDGCTLTPGYWKTHSMYGPAPYDPTWAMIGEDTPFFLSGQSYYQVLWTVPAGGNAYYILAHAYIAAELNFLNGADPSAAQAAFDQATSLFGMYTPAQVADKTNKALRASFLSLAEILDNYNNGLIGPGHCEE